VQNLVFVAEPGTLLNDDVAILLALVVVEPGLLVVHHYALVPRIQWIVNGLEFDWILVEADPIDVMPVSVVDVWKGGLIRVVPLQGFKQGFQPDVSFIPGVVFLSGIGGVLFLEWQLVRKQIAYTGVATGLQDGVIR